MRLGIVTYNIAKDWDLPTILKNCQETKFTGVELRTTHAHKVEATLTPAQRADVRKRFGDSDVELAGLGTAFEFHALDPAEVRKNVEGTKQYVKLAHDLGCLGVKVRPNGVQTDRGVPLEKTIDQIGRALRECGEFAAGYGVEIRVEVHGRVTAQLPVMQKIMQAAGHPSVFVCWNSNPTDVASDGKVEQHYRLVEKYIREVHLRDLFDEKYPWRELFRLLTASNYEGYCLAEIPDSPDPLRVLRYFRALYYAYQPAGSAK